MKQYIKPTTDVQNIAMHVYMQSASKITTDSTPTDERGGAKSRDVWSDGFWD